MVTAAEVAQRRKQAQPEQRGERAPRGQEPGVHMDENDTFCFLTLDGQEGYAQFLWDIIMEHVPIRLLAGGRGSGLQPGREPGMLGVRGLCLVVHKTDLPEKYQI